MDNWAKSRDGKSAYNSAVTSKRCTSTIKNVFTQFFCLLVSLPISVGALYIRKYFNEESKNAALELMDGIREEFIDILHNLTWMDEETKKTAIEKAGALTKHIGYPNELADNAKLEEYYNDLDIEADNLLLNTLRLTVFRTNYAYGKLHEPVNKTDWITHSKPALVNAFYAALENSIRK